jgi:zinc protease
MSPSAERTRLPIQTAKLARLVAFFAVWMVLPPALFAAEIVPTRFTTANGMTVLVLEQHFLPIVEVHALVKTGSAQDPPEKAGLANLTASLLDEGTTNRIVWAVRWR